VFASASSAVARPHVALHDGCFGRRGLNFDHRLRHGEGDAERGECRARILACDGETRTLDRGDLRAALHVFVAHDVRNDVVRE